MDLSTPLEKAFRLNPLQKIGLKKLKLETVKDLLFYFPGRYEEPGQIRNIRDLTEGEEVVIYGKVLSAKTLKGWKSKIPMAEAIIDDGTSKIKAVWFHQAYMAKKIPVGHFGEFRGKITRRKDEIYLANPDVREALPTMAAKNSLFTQNSDEKSVSNNLFLIPVYSETRGLSSGWFYYHIQTILKTGLSDKLVDPLPEEIIKRYNLPRLKTALVWIHSPKKASDASAAKKRFSFEEILYIQLKRLRDKQTYQSNPSFAIKVTAKEIQEFVGRFPFPLTTAQNKAIKQIMADLGGDKPMTRLLEGDVGSGKTAVAATTAFAVVKSGFEVAYMAPTEILARQHFESFIEYFKHIPNIGIGLMTGSECRKFPSKLGAGHTHLSKTQLLKWVADGRIPILIGTHSLIQKTVKFKNLAYTIIDEQHRFGVYQRAALVRRTNAERTQNCAENNFLYKDLSYQIRSAIFNVKKGLGSGHKEVVYQRALEEEFKQNNLKFDRENRIPILYGNKNVGTYIPDFVVEDKIIVELKTIPFIGSAEKKQLWSYLKGSKYKVALLVNFSPTELQIERIVYDTARENSAFVLRSSASSPHLLSMTATPIPRTLALTVYGDLDLTLLDEMPKGRKAVITEIIAPDKRAETYEFIRTQIKAGRQAYVICPRIDEPDPDKEMALIAKSAVAEQERLGTKIFPEFMVGLVHSKMRPTEKEEMMSEFTAGKIDILVATSVIEVGVNVANATIIIIEGAERFGLAQLHQLRGRVIRSNHQAYCFLFSETKSAKSFARLKALKTAKNGFELAEQDLALRGAGGLSAGKQWGISDIGMEAIQNIKMVEAARTEAQNLLKADLELKKYPLIKEKISGRQTEIHFE
jgi:GxxExxY protein